MQIFPSSKTPQQHTSRSKYKLTIQEKENASQKWIYHGSHDPKTIREQGQSPKGAIGSADGGGNGKDNVNGNGSSAQEKSVVLMYDPSRNAFVLEEVDAKLNFNMVQNTKEPDAPLSQRYEQLEVADGTETVSSSNEDEEDAEFNDIDSGNPYDWRHFAKKAIEERKRQKEKEEKKALEAPSPFQLSQTSSNVNATPIPEPTKPKPAKAGAKGKAAGTASTARAAAGTTTKATKAGTTAGTTKAKAKTGANQPKRKPGRPAGSTSAAKAQAAKVKSAETMPKDDELDDDDDHKPKMEHEYKDGEIIDLPSFIPPTKPAPKKRGPQKKSAAAQKDKKAEHKKEPTETYDDEDEFERGDDFTATPPQPNLSNKANIEVVDGSNLIIDWGSPLRERTPISFNQHAAGFNQIDDDDEELEHVGVASIIQAKRKEGQNKLDSEMDEEEEEDDGDEDDGDGEGDEEGNNADENVEAEPDAGVELEAEMMALFEGEQVESKPRDDDESSVSEEE